MNIHWAPLLGDYKLHGNTLIYIGGSKEYHGERTIAIGNFIANRTFAGGHISAEIEFKKIDEYTGCEIIIYYDPTTKFFVTAGLGTSGLYAIRHFQNQWFVHDSGGDRENLQANKKYYTKVSVTGSRVALNVNGVDVLSTHLPYQLDQSQVGLWCSSLSNINISNFEVHSEPAKAFIVMQFTPPYNELYEDVIERICSEFRLEAIRVDKVYGPGIILADIIKQITESKIIIAEITPENANVYYEIGYAHALGKPTILIAQKDTKLPFDVSPFRVLFYENSISGKRLVEEGLRKHIKAVMERSIN